MLKIVNKAEFEMMQEEIKYLKADRDFWIDRSNIQQRLYLEAACARNKAQDELYQMRQQKEIK